MEGMLSDEQVKAYERDGFLVLAKFLTEEQCDALKRRMSDLIAQWKPEDYLSVFSTDEAGNLGRDTYFFDSADRISFFCEPKAVADDGKSLVNAKHLCINKVGHALHEKDEVFHQLSFSDKVKNVSKSLGYKHTVVPQSMYIFKQPFVGGEVTLHQDSTFLYTAPRQSCLGMWFALEDATEENGCLWAVPGSHKLGTETHFAREKDENGRVSMGFRRLRPAPSEVQLTPLCALPMKKGDMVLIHGDLYHMSKENTSPKSRHSYQLHMVEGPEEGCIWSALNWMQRDSEFPRLYEQ